MRFQTAILSTAVLATLAIASQTLKADPLVISATANGTIETRYNSFFSVTLSQQAQVVMPSPISYQNATGSLQLAISAPTGKKFQVTPYANDPTFLRFATYYNGNIGTLALNGTPSASFTGLTGTAPSMDASSYSYLSSHGTGQTAFGASGTVSAPFSFTSLVITLPISGTGSNAPLSLSDGNYYVQVTDGSYTGPGAAPYPVLLSFVDDVPSVPEPASLSLLSVGAACLLVRRRRA